MYSIREEAETNFVKVMKEIKNMGYDGVELAGLYGLTPELMRDTLKEIGLIPISAHVSYEAFVEDLQGTLNRYVTIGCRYLVIPYLSEDCRYGKENYNQVINNIISIAKECQKNGFTLLYHNHDFEFEKTEEGNYVLDAMYEQIAEELLMTELDLCWVKVAGEQPTEYIKKYAGRCPVVHLKDYNGSSPFEFRALGYGVQDIPAILKEVLKAGTEWVVVEQDDHSENTAIEDTRLSREYLQTLGW